MSEQYLITLDEWKPKRFSLPITNTTLVKYGKLGYIVPRPQKIRGRWLIDRRAVLLGLVKRELRRKFILAMMMH